MKATELGSPRLPPYFENAARISEPVRLRLSVSASGRLVDGALDVVLGHGLGLGRDDRGAQPRIVRRVRHAEPRGHRDFAAELGEQLGALLIGAPLLVHDVLELGMTGHAGEIRLQAAVR
jgi:hypothetical protein